MDPRLLGAPHDVGNDGGHDPDAVANPALPFYSVDPAQRFTQNHQAAAAAIAAAQLPQLYLPTPAASWTEALAYQQQQQQLLETARGLQQSHPELYGAAAAAAAAQPQLGAEGEDALHFEEEDGALSNNNLVAQQIAMYQQMGYAVRGVPVVVPVPSAATTALAVAAQRQILASHLGTGEEYPPAQVITIDDSDEEKEADRQFVPLAQTYDRSAISGFPPVNAAAAAHIHSRKKARYSGERRASSEQVPQHDHNSHAHRETSEKTSFEPPLASKESFTASERHRSQQSRTHRETSEEASYQPPLASKDSLAAAEARGTHHSQRSRAEDGTTHPRPASGAKRSHPAIFTDKALPKIAGPYVRETLKRQKITPQQIEKLASRILEVILKQPSNNDEHKYAIGKSQLYVVAKEVLVHERQSTQLAVQATMKECQSRHERIVKRFSSSTSVTEAAGTSTTTTSQPSKKDGKTKKQDEAKLRAEIRKDVKLQYDQDIKALKKNHAAEIAALKEKMEEERKNHARSMNAYMKASVHSFREMRKRSLYGTKHTKVDNAEEAEVDKEKRQDETKDREGGEKDVDKGEIKQNMQ